jgi:hypothetical protein
MIKVPIALRPYIYPSSKCIAVGEKAEKAVCFGPSLAQPPIFSVAYWPIRIAQAFLQVIQGRN